MKLFRKKRNSSYNKEESLKKCCKNIEYLFQKGILRISLQETRVKVKYRWYDLGAFLDESELEDIRTKHLMREINKCISQYGRDELICYIEKNKPQGIKINAEELWSS